MNLLRLQFFDLDETPLIKNVSPLAIRSLYKERDRILLDPYLYLGRR